MRKKIMCCILLTSILFMSGTTNKEVSPKIHSNTYQVHTKAKQVKLIHMPTFIEYEQGILLTKIKHEQRQKPICRFYSIPLSKDLQEYTYKECMQYGIQNEYPTILAIMWHESNFTSDLISKTQDYGIMQINICNHKSLAKTLHIVNFLDTKSNIHAGIYMYSSHFRTYNSRTKALMAYNLGSYGMKEKIKHGNYNSSYSRAVEKKIKQLNKM